MGLVNTTPVILFSYGRPSGSSSAVERQLPKLDVTGSIPVSRSIIPITDSPGNLLLRPERPGMEFHGLADVRQEICQAVITGIKVILVLNALGQKLLVQGLSALFKTVVILLAAVEIDGQLPQPSFIFLRQNKRAVFFPVRHIDRLSEDCPQQLGDRRARVFRRIHLLS